MRLEKPKSNEEAATMKPPTPGNAALKAFTVIPVLVLSVQTPVTKTARAVKVQITMVSMNTSKEAMRPCLTGSPVRAAAWNTAAVPVPASFE